MAVIKKYLVILSYQLIKISPEPDGSVAIEISWLWFVLVDMIELKLQTLGSEKLGAKGN